MHTQVLRPVHPAAKMCTPGAGCTLNFELCHVTDTSEKLAVACPLIQRCDIRALVPRIRVEGPRGGYSLFGGR